MVFHSSLFFFKQLEFWFTEFPSLRFDVCDQHSIRESFISLDNYIFLILHFWKETLSNYESEFMFILSALAMSKINDYSITSLAFTYIHNPQ